MMRLLAPSLALLLVALAPAAAAGPGHPLDPVWACVHFDSNTLTIVIDKDCLGEIRVPECSIVTDPHTGLPRPRCA